MALDNNKLKLYSKRLLLSRVRLLNNYSFYGLMLMNMKFQIDEKCETAYTTGKKICFSPKFMDDLSDSELDFVLMHEVLHVALKHCIRGKNMIHDIFNIAADIVVNSNILKSCDMDVSKITLKKYGEAMHTLPNKEEGYNYTLEEVYNILLKDAKFVYVNGFDDHGQFSGDENDLKDINSQIISISSIIEETKGIGSIPNGVLIEIERLTKPKVNWKEALAEFLKYEVFDYSFTPPDRRYDDFFLPDFNDTKETYDINVLFAIDTSGSMALDEIAQALSELKSLIAFTSNNVSGFVTSFDTKVYDLISIDTFDLKNIKLKGRGGTSYKPIFNNLDNIEKQLGKKIDLIIIMTDGKCDFPDESARKDIPVMWIITTDVVPPWGKYTKINV